MKDNWKSCLCLSDQEALENPCVKTEQFPPLTILSLIVWVSYSMLRFLHGPLLI